MATNNQTTLITSMNKAIVRARKTGLFNPAIIQVFEMLKYYIEWTDAQIALGYTSMISDNQALKDLLRDLKYRYPSIICNYKNIVPSVISPPIPNTAPVVDNVVYSLGTDTIYQFTVGDFLENYTDAEGHLWKYLIVDPTALTEGQLLIETSSISTTSSTDISTTPGYEYTPILVNYQISIEGLAPTTSLNLYYRRKNEEGYNNDVITFRVSDNPVAYLFSAPKTFTISALATSSVNQPPTIGDNTVYVSNRATTTLSLFMFAGGLTPPYNDPENDLIDAIRIVDISGANQGEFLYNGTAITVGQIITREDIDAGLFTHEGPDQDAISSDVFEFEVRDEGNGTWIG